MFVRPQGYRVRGQLRDCDRCGFEYRWIQLRMQFGLWLCPTDLDNEIRRQSGLASNVGSTNVAYISPPTGLSGAIAPFFVQGIDLTWNAVTGADNYHIFRSVVGENGPFIFLGGSSGATSYRDNYELVEFDTYYYKVSAHNPDTATMNAGESYGTAVSPWSSPTGFSNIISVLYAGA